MCRGVGRCGGIDVDRVGRRSTHCRKGEIGEDPADNGGGERPSIGEELATREPFMANGEVEEEREPSVTVKKWGVPIPLLSGVGMGKEINLEGEGRNGGRGRSRRHG